MELITELAIVSQNIQAQYLLSGVFGILPEQDLELIGSHSR